MCDGKRARRRRRRGTEPKTRPPHRGEKGFLCNAGCVLNLFRRIKNRVSWHFPVRETSWSSLDCASSFCFVQNVVLVGALLRAKNFFLGCFPLKNPTVAESRSCFLAPTLAQRSWFWVLSKRGSFSQHITHFPHLGWLSLQKRENRSGALVFALLPMGCVFKIPASLIWHCCDAMCGA